MNDRAEVLELREKVAELEARLAAAMGALQSLRDKCAREGWVEGMFAMMDANKALAGEPPASKRYRAIKEAAEAETEAEDQLSTTFIGATIDHRPGMEHADALLYEAREARRKAVRGEVTDGE